MRCARPRKKRVAALVFVGDCFEENLDEVGQIAGQLGMQGVRAFLFQEGHNPEAERAFRHIAKLTNGAHCRFNSSSPQQLRDLLGAVAAYAAGGRRALADLSQALRPRGATAGEPGPLGAMVSYLLIGVIVLLGLVLLARAASSRPIRRSSPRACAPSSPAFSALASTGLLFAGRFGLALVTIGATFMAIRAMSRARAGGPAASAARAPASGAPRSPPTPCSMELDHRTGELEGEVLRGRFAGRSLASLGVSDLLELLAECQREDPRSVPAARDLSRSARARLARATSPAAAARARGCGGRRRHDGRGDRMVDPRPRARRQRGRDQGRASSPDDQAASRPRRLGYLAAQLNQAKDYCCAASADRRIATAPSSDDAAAASVRDSVSVQEPMRLRRLAKRRRCSHPAPYGPAHAAARRGHRARVSH